MQATSRAVGTLVNEREGWRSRSVPHFALLRARRFRSDPLALLPLSWPDGRWRTVVRAHHPAGYAPCKGADVVPLRDWGARRLHFR